MVRESAWRYAVALAVELVRELRMRNPGSLEGARPLGRAVFCGTKISAILDMVPEDYTALFDTDFLGSHGDDLPVLPRLS